MSSSFDCFCSTFGFSSGPVPDFLTAFTALALISLGIFTRTAVDGSQLAGYKLNRGHL
ncbi:hypothetical protein SAMD00019534_061870 [Acytostelium subglobosum LB1]|uniref:hypothetical protein n=1 Tax=Acytostelium subglobosum LB1 TaxID=1410327 RepID=UPI0006450725|nr:hypothetical protein SAMD00019534_061870 [Acytostelium subglobosum LB1]GAM23012.1 hypothetical protein SAMD00019534_061870 [Acytostelium subglobosum LB1]|eukprot:XP_012754239.1 hypothetical protein SAMD00019534_061870 [Acytostelium subglobosum LB1]